ncbi:MAG: S24 family peptidase [Gemmatimonadaceae bacterium]|nr:S24 family peptidase [Gemmatimonadaceae bacterium]
MTDSESRQPSIEKLVAQRSDATGLDHEGFVDWLIRDTVRAMTVEEKRDTQKHAQTFAEQLEARLAAERIMKEMPVMHLYDIPAPVVGRVREVFPIAASLECVPLIDSRVAAGEGRELLDEEAERWIEFPLGNSAAGHVALHVSGASMSPFLENGDVIVVKLGARVTINDIIVARRPDEGYVVKRVKEITNSRLKLTSLNPRSRSFDIPKDLSLVLGTVIARFRRTA